MPASPPVVLTIAGSDCSSGAGIQADIKTVTALGGYAATAITALTIQNTMGVNGVVATPPKAVRAQMEAVLKDIGADVLKTGMLGDKLLVETIAETPLDQELRDAVEQRMREYFEMSAAAMVNSDD